MRIIKLTARRIEVNAKKWKKRGTCSYVATSERRKLTPSPLPGAGGWCGDRSFGACVESLQNFNTFVAKRLSNLQLLINTWEISFAFYNYVRKLISARAASNTTLFQRPHRHNNCAKLAVAPSPPVLPLSFPLKNEENLRRQFFVVVTLGGGGRCGEPTQWPNSLEFVVHIIKAFFSASPFSNNWMELKQTGGRKVLKAPMTGWTFQGRSGERHMSDVKPSAKRTFLHPPPVSL